MTSLASASGGGRPTRADRKDKHQSRQGRTKEKPINSKKKGAGGKFVWGNATDLYEYEPVLDKGDPN